MKKDLMYGLRNKMLEESIRLKFPEDMDGFQNI